MKKTKKSRRRRRGGVQKKKKKKKKKTKKREKRSRRRSRRRRRRSNRRKFFYLVNKKAWQLRLRRNGLGGSQVVAGMMKPWARCRDWQVTTPYLYTLRHGSSALFGGQQSRIWRVRCVANGNILFPLDHLVGRTMSSSQPNNRILLLLTVGRSADQHTSSLTCPLNRSPMKGQWLTVSFSPQGLSVTSRPCLRPICCYAFVCTSICLCSTC